MARPGKMTRVNYSQFLLSSQNNYTITYFAEHAGDMSHDAINHYLLKDKLTPKLLWEHISPGIIYSPNGYIIFDDTVLDKDDSRYIELVRWQYSGNEGRVIRGIGVITCVYYNPELNRFWVIDYRIYAPHQDGKGKLDHLTDMLKHAHYKKQILYSTVLMDTWYAAVRIMKAVSELKKIFYCALKSNRLVSRVDQRYDHIQVTKLSWNETELRNGIRIHLNKSSPNYHVQLFRIDVSTHKTEYVTTNDLTQKDTNNVQKAYGYRYTIEQLHREVKNVTGIERCQCRKQRIQRNHIACAFLVWARLKNIAYKTGQTVYQLKQNLLRDYLIQQLKSPAISMSVPLIE
jgi:hypothetical protein